MANVLLDICLSDLPKAQIKEAKNGKKYIKLVVAERKSADERGYDHYVKVYIPKEQRKEGDKPVYVGSGKAAQKYTAPNSEPASASQAGMKDDDLPF